MKRWEFWTGIAVFVGGLLAVATYGWLFYEIN